MKDFINEINIQVADKPIVEALKFLSERFKQKIIFSSSFSYEDQVITDVIFKNNIPIPIFTLDTGRLFPETFDVFNKTNKKYGKKVKVYFPESKDVEELVNNKGPFSFYHSVENRIECCNIRKVEPLKRALNGMECWITGLRKEQSASRENLQIIEWDEGNDILKYNPLLNWNLDWVKHYISENNVPYNILHEKGFISIGCSCCTRAIQEGEDIRSGRWWWEDTTKKECGLHSRNIS